MYILFGTDLHVPVSTLHTVKVILLAILYIKKYLCSLTHDNAANISIQQESIDFTVPE